jgi:hypothetical protein
LVTTSKTERQGAQIKKSSQDRTTNDEQQVEMHESGDEVDLHVMMVD